MQVERKFDWISTRSFDRQYKALLLNEFEDQIIIATIGNFCTNIHRSIFNPKQVEDKLYFKIPVVLFTRKLQISFEVVGIDALAYKIEEVDS